MYALCRVIYRFKCALLIYRKSSLMVALFRIENLRDGKIVIDGMDIADMPLRKLRSKVVIIPQDAVLFAKTVRFNVDPFDWHSDDEIWTALTCVNLHETVRSLSNQLNEKVSEGGANFSAGQRQVIALFNSLCFFYSSNVNAFSG